MIEAGKFYKAKVIRKSDLGFMLSIGEEEILMHYKQSKKEYINGEEVSVFIYYDKANRLCATSNNVYCSTLKPGKVRVCDKIDSGLFIDNNTSKDVFVSSDYLPRNKSLWPNVDDNIYTILLLKKDKLEARILNRELCKKYHEGNLLINDSYEGIVSEINNGGYGIITHSFNFVFVPFELSREKYHVGSLVNVKINKEGNGIYYGTLLLNKELQLVDDTNIILEYLKSHKGFMPFTAKSSSEAIELEFKISRKAFKRAYGKLYKEQIIDFDDKGTYLKK